MKETMQFDPLHGTKDGRTLLISLSLSDACAHLQTSDTGKKAGKQAGGKERRKEDRK